MRPAIAPNTPPPSTSNMRQPKKRTQSKSSKHRKWCVYTSRLLYYRQHGKGRKAVEGQNIELHYVFAHMIFNIVMGVIIITVIPVINERGIKLQVYNKQGRRKAFSKLAKTT